MNIRNATTADIAGMHRVRVSVRENALSHPGRSTEADYVEALTTLGRGWVAESADGIVGFAIAYRSGEIWALFVHPSHEGQGHGRALHASMLDWLGRQGLERLWLTTAPGTRAEAFYRRLGWQPCGVAPSGEVRLERDGRR